ncbi:MAG: nucleotide exchange factor GrpE [Longimicrobiales bacterium]
MTDDTRHDKVIEQNAAEDADIDAPGNGEENRGPDVPDTSVTDEVLITPEDIESEIESLQRDLAGTNDRYLRLAAEFENYRKRVERERTELYARAQTDLARRLLDVVDDLERVAQFDANAAAAALVDGVQLVEKKLLQTLQSFGLEPIDAEGAVFDPRTMEAIATTEAGHPEEDDVVADVFQKGYQFKGQLLRPARVRVKKYED